MLAEIDPALVEQLAPVIRDPVLYVRGFLGHDPWETPERILRALDTPRAKVAVKSCHASGKTHTASEAVIAHVTRDPSGVALTTAPTWTQVKDVLWREIREAVSGARVAFPKPATVSWNLGLQQYAKGLSTNEGVRFQGFHGRILLVVDEAAGVRPAIIEAAKGIAAGGDVRFLWLGNPTIPSGPFYDAFARPTPGWTLITISAFDTPNFAGLGRAGDDGSPPEAFLALSDDDLDRNARPYLITRRWVREMWDECDHNPEHPFWQARVLGEFPTQATDALIPLAWIEAARRRFAELPDTDDPIIAGLDVAGPGEDETCLVLRTQAPIWRVRPIEAWKQAEPQQLVAQHLAACGPALVGGGVDTIGIGHYFRVLLRDAGFPLTAVNVSETARNATRFANRKAELYWALRDRFRAGLIALPDDELLFAQLAGLRYSQDARGRIVIESKEQARKRGVRSPDRAEALMLSCVCDGADLTTETAGPRQRSGATADPDDDTDGADLALPSAWTL